MEQYLETRPAQGHEEEFKAIRRGWCLGRETFRKEFLAPVGAGRGVPYRADERRETTEGKGRRILNEELDKLGWTGAALAQRAKGDMRKVSMARRLRAETAVTLKWIAKKLHMGTWSHGSNLLSRGKHAQPTKQTELNLFQK